MIEPSSRRRRLLALFATIVGLIALARVTGLGHHLDTEKLRATMVAAGPFGVVLFLGAFTLGVLAYLPGAIFVAAGTLAYGKSFGFFVNFVGGVMAMCTSFGVARAIGGQHDGEVERPWLRRMLARVEARPVLWLSLVRMVTFISPPLNTALALSRIRFRDFALGSAIGLVVPMAITTFALDWLVQLPVFARLLKALLG
ncbi:MAG: TVP38/TMEM64 family protein [Deltaproteobacteria bacterium]|nr:TVP38/TMEM64 family protein [Deltaproteobacteria bacterium]